MRSYIEMLRRDAGIEILLQNNVERSDISSPRILVEHRKLLEGSTNTVMSFDGN